MDVFDIGSLIGTLRNTLGLLKDAQGMLPKGTTEEIGRMIADVEKKAEAFEADAAVKLGYPICRGHWPPTVMLESDKRFVFKCPDCGKEIDTTPSIDVVRSKNDFHDRLKRT